MPIIDNSEPSRPLSQGDILKDINLFVTAGGWMSSNGTAQTVPNKMCMVLSRPCVIAHKATVIVATVEKYPDAPPRELDSFKKVQSFLIGFRDGVKSPDVFYLGHFPQYSGRYCAKLDELHTIQIPGSEEERQQFVKSKRIGTLHPDFARDLHTRLFRAVASLGFDDHGWLSDNDLDWLVAQGEADLKLAEARVSEQEAKEKGQAAKGEKFDTKQKNNAQREVENLKEELKPFQEERKRRNDLKTIE